MKNSELRVPATTANRSTIRKPAPETQDVLLLWAIKLNRLERID